MTNGTASLHTEESGVGRVEDVRRSAMQSVFVAWIFGAAWMHITAGVAQTRLAKLLELPPFGYGVLAAIPFAGALLQLPTSYFIERYGHRKGIFITSGVIHRSIWILIGLIPWLLTGRWSWAAFLAAVFVSAAMNNVATPVWVTWMSELVPPRIRGRYFSMRTQAGQMVGLGVTVCVGWLLDHAAAQGGRMPQALIAALFAVAGAAGIADFLFFLKVPAPAAPSGKEHASLVAIIREPLKDRNFRRFLGFMATMTFGTAFTGQFIWLFLFDVAKMSNTRASILCGVAPLIIAMLAARVWGRVLDRVGRKPVLTICSLLVIQGGAVWVFVQGPHWWVGYLGIVVASLAWPGVELANFNMLLSMGDSANGRRHGTACVAVNSFVVALSGMLSGFFGGAVAQWVGDWHATVFGYVLTYHAVILFLSLGIRASALLWVRKLEEPRACGTRHALAYVGSSALANLASLADLIAVPGRLVLRVGQWTYRITPGTAWLRRRR